jgi:hemerythrin-like domain-containing protein
MTEAINTIRLEHHRLASVLACFRYLIDELQSGRVLADLTVLFAILDYLEAFPDTFHHPKEERYLFAALRRRRPEAGDLIDRLCDQHAEGVELLTRLRSALADYRRDASSFGELRRLASAYVDFEYAHIKCEEQELLPQVLSALEDEDWAEIDAAFAQNDDPLFGRVRAEQFKKLYATILELVPDPEGPQQPKSSKARDLGGPK